MIKRTLLIFIKTYSFLIICIFKEINQKIYMPSKVNNFVRQKVESLNNNWPKGPDIPSAFYF
jgi:hypothetical protein